VTQPPEQPFDEESLLRALRAPGSAGELGDEEQYVAMFREAQAPSAGAPIPLASRRRRAVSRFGAGSAFVVALAVGGSAAAAYTNNLPEPIQRFAHRALGPVAPPAPEERQPRAKGRPAAAPTASSTPTPTPTPTPSDTPTPSSSPTRSPSPRPSHSPKPTPTPTPTATPTPTPTPSATPTPTATPSATPTPTAPPTATPTPPLPVVPAAVSISGSTHKVEPGQSVAFAGVVTADDGTPVRRSRVSLQTLSGGGWTTVTSGRTDASGQVSLVLPPISATTGVRLRTTGVHSPRWRVTLHPELTVTSARGPESGTVVITVTAVGAQPGDRIQLVTKSGEVASGTLEGSTVTFTVSPTQKKTRYTALLPRSSAHGPDRASITVIVKKPGEATTGG
jgi:outer membrane biosynthesis protein TonB